jgi:hypothetical protein
VHEFTGFGRARFLNVHAPACGFIDYRGALIERPAERAGAR